MTRTNRAGEASSDSPLAEGRARTIGRLWPAVVGVMAVLLLAMGSGVAGAADRPGQAAVGGEGPAAADGTPAAPIQVLGVQVFIDPQTGRMRPPTAEEAAALSEAMKEWLAGASARAAHQPQAKTLPNGTVVMELDPSLMNFSVVRVGPDGSRSHDCVKGHDHAVDVVQRVPAAAADLVAEE